MFLHHPAIIAVVVVMSMMIGCSHTAPRSTAPAITFADEVQTNTEIPADIQSLSFVDSNGETIRLSDYLDRKHVVLVITQGFSGTLCPFCLTQTSRLIANYDKFRDAGAEVLVVYPGSSHLDEFIAAAKGIESRASEIPFPILLDRDLSAVKFFNIESDLAHPSTFIIDRRGNVRLAYVGADRSADRPSIDAMLDVLKTSE